MATSEEWLQKLLARVDKELIRQEQGTAAVGGMTKLGAALEGMVKACHREALTLVEPNKRPAPGRLPAGPGEWLRALAMLGSPKNAKPLVLAVVTDAQRPDGMLPRLARIRNVVAHEADIPRPADTRRLLQEIRRWLGGLAP